MKTPLFAMLLCLAGSLFALDNATLNATAANMTGLPPNSSQIDIPKVLWEDGSFEEAVLHAISSGFSNMLEKHFADASIAILALFIVLGGLATLKFISALKATLVFLLTLLMIVAVYVALNWAGLI